MSEFTTGTVRDLRYLYENAVYGEQEVLSEDIARDAGSNLRGLVGRAAKTNLGDVARTASNVAGNVVKTVIPGAGLAAAAIKNAPSIAKGVSDIGSSAIKGAGGYGTGSSNPLARLANTATRFGTPSGLMSTALRGGASFTSGLTGAGKPPATPAGKPPATPAGKPPATPAGKPPATPAGKPPATAPGGAGAGSPPNARSMPTRPVLSKQGGVEGTGTGANFKAGAWSSADKSRYSAQAAKPASSGNQSLVTAAAERARTRGTQQTDNPLMKDFKSSLPMNSPSVQAPAVAKLGAGNQSLSQNQNAFQAAPVKSASPAATPGVGQRAAAMPSMGSSQYKATTPSAAVAAAPSSSPAASGSVVPATNKIAAMKQQPEVKPQAIAASYEYDAYDLVLEYLLDDGHAATIAEAEYIMTELDSEVINQIVETRLDPRGRPASGPMNVYRDPKGKPDQAHLDAIKSYDEKQKKKTPEQRKKELDAYIARQRNK